MASDLQHETRPGPSTSAKGGWTPGRIAAVTAGSVLALACLALLGGAGLATWADAEHGGYLTTGTASYSTTGYALAGDPMSLPGGWGWLGRIAGKARIQVTPAVPGKPVFAAIAPAGAAQRYLADVGHTTVTAFGDDDVAEHPGTAAPAPPAAALPWAASAEGSGSVTLTWTVTEGDWTVLVMNPDGSGGLAVRVAVAVSSPLLPALAAELLGAGLLAGLAAGALILVPVRLAARRP
ncbi:MAG TPA: hypothetical protein VKV35_14250 [Streptosporangiaceae bacterium]|jgi:hypothetical protein|nr:hypothetical protein [Streptosporangiaceae bacterium]